METLRTASRSFASPAHVGLPVEYSSHGITVPFERQRNKKVGVIST
jgi:hypothetical protein